MLSSADVDRHIQQTNERLACIRQQLFNRHSFEQACKELIQWCSDPRAFQSCYEQRLIDCLEIVHEVSQQGEFCQYNTLICQLFNVCNRYANTGFKSAPGFRDNLISWYRKLAGTASCTFPSAVAKPQTQSLLSTSSTVAVSSSVTMMQNHHMQQQQQPQQQLIHPHMAQAPMQKMQQQPFNPALHVDQMSWSQQQMMPQMMYQNGRQQYLMSQQQQNMSPQMYQQQNQQQPNAILSPQMAAKQGMYPGQAPSPAQMMPSANVNYYAAANRPQPISVPASQQASGPQQFPQQQIPSPADQLRFQFNVQQQQQQHQQMVMMSNSASRSAPYPNPQELAMRRRMQQQQQQQQQPPQQSPQIMSPMSPLNPAALPSNVTPFKVQAPVVQAGGGRAYIDQQPQPQQNNAQQLAMLQAHQQQAQQARLLAAQHRNIPQQQQPVPPSLQRQTSQTGPYHHQVSSPPVVPPQHQQQPYKIPAPSPASHGVLSPPPQQIVRVENSPQLVIQQDVEPRLTLPIKDGVILPPFRLEHMLSTSNHSFLIRDQVFGLLMNKTSDLELQLKCFHHEDRTMQTSWPASVSVSVNGQALMIDRSPGATVLTDRPGSPNKTVSSTRPLFIKNVCHPGQNVLTISVTNCCCSHLFVLELVQRPTLRSLQQNVIRKRLLPKDQCIAKMKRVFFSSNNSAPDRPDHQEVEIMTESAPLRCPISQQLIQTPCRSSECRHLRCFDLYSFLALHSDRAVWQCPVCVRQVNLDDLEIDQFMWDVLQFAQQQQMPPQQLASLDVIVDQEGNWKLIKQDPQALYQRQIQQQQQILLQQQQQQQLQQAQQIPASVAAWNISSTQEQPGVNYQPTNQQNMSQQQQQQLEPNQQQPNFSIQIQTQNQPQALNSSQQNYLPPTPTSTIPGGPGSGSSAGNTPYAADSVSSVGSNNGGHNSVPSSQSASSSNASNGGNSGVAPPTPSTMNKPATPAVGLPHSIAMTPQSPMSVGAHNGPPSNPSSHQHQYAHHSHNETVVYRTANNGSVAMGALVEDLVAESQASSQQQYSQQQIASELDFDINFFEELLQGQAAAAASQNTAPNSGSTGTSNNSQPVPFADFSQTATASGQNVNLLGNHASTSEDPFEGIFDP